MSSSTYAVVDLPIFLKRQTFKNAMSKLGDNLQASLDEISSLLARDKQLEEADPVAWRKKQFNPTNEPDPIYDPLAKFESQLRAYKEGKKEFDLEEYDRLHPAPEVERVGTLETAATDVADAGGRIDAERWNGTAVEPTDLSLQATPSPRRSPTGFSGMFCGRRRPLRAHRRSSRWWTSRTCLPVGRTTSWTI